MSIPPPRTLASTETILRDIPPDTTSEAAPIVAFETRQPRGLYTLFLTEMWERFSYYGMKAQLVLYLITAVSAGGLGWSTKEAGNLMAWYSGLVYLTPMAGGYLADRVLGTSRCLVIGGAIIALGHFTLLLDTRWALYAGLACVVVGTGFFKSNVSTMVGQLYRQGDPRRDAGFTIFYMGINLGAFFAPLVCGWLQVFLGQKYGAGLGWRVGFAAAGVGMVFGLTQYLIGRSRHLRGVGDPPVTRSGGSAAAHTALTREERRRVAAIFIVAFFVIFFFSGFEQSGTSMAFFAQLHTDRSLPSWLAWLVGGADAGGAAEFPAAWFQSINPLLILMLAPIFASMWVRLARVHKEPSTPMKMGIGLITLGAGFIFMVLAGRISDGGVRSAPIWIAATLFVHTCAELCLSPVGLSLVTKLAPLKFASLLMGVWFLAAFAGNFAAGKAAAISEQFTPSYGFLLHGQADFYLMFAVAPVVAGAVLLALVPVLNRMMHGRA
jgi:POT family proton-dependent oligopeptide transporter